MKRAPTNKTSLPNRPNIRTKSTLFSSSLICSNTSITCTSAATTATFGGRQFPGRLSEQNHSASGDRSHSEYLSGSRRRGRQRFPSPTDPDLAQKVLGLDNAFALNLPALIEGLTGDEIAGRRQPDFLRSRLSCSTIWRSKERFPITKECTRSLSPIAGLEGGEEGGALNEGQADMWAFTITDNPSLWAIMSSTRQGYRQRFRDRGRNPDSVAYIRSARSTLKYSRHRNFARPHDRTRRFLKNITTAKFICQRCGTSAKCSIAFTRRTRLTNARARTDGRR